MGRGKALARFLNRVRPRLGQIYFPACRYEYFKDYMIIKEIEVKSVMTKSNLPVSDFYVNPYVGCSHACKYCYASFMKRFTNHSEPWGTFVDVKMCLKSRRRRSIRGKKPFLVL